MSSRRTASGPRRSAGVGALHGLLVCASYLLAVWLRFEFTFPERERTAIFAALPVLVALRLLLFARWHLFLSWWHYVGIRDVLDIAASTTAGSLAFVSGIVTTGAFPGFPRSVFVLEWLLTVHVLVGARILARWSRGASRRLRTGWQTDALIVGSGAHAETAARELLEHPVDLRPIGFLQTGSGPDRSRLRGLPCLGHLDDLERVVRERAVGEVIVAVGPAPAPDLGAIARRCRAIGVPFRVLPSIRQRLDDPRPPDAQELEALFDPDGPIEVSNAARTSLSDRCVLVLGAGGRIGSALARAVVEAGARHVVLFDRNESALYYLEVRLLASDPPVSISPVIGDLRDPRRVRDLFESYRPEIVLYAAGYTNPDLFAENREEFVDNNLRSLENTLSAAEDSCAQRFLLLSAAEDRRDPTVCIARSMERRIATRPARSPTIAAAVRFPEVLGSPACLVTRAARALQRREPLTVPSPDVSVPLFSKATAARLVLEALVFATDGAILSILPGRSEPLWEVLRTLRQVWNLPEIPIRPADPALDHDHTPGAGLATGHPRVVIRVPEAESPPCVARLASSVDAPGGKGETRRANPRRGR